MGCRVGISTNPETRKTQWESIYKQIRNWKIVGGPYNKKEAQDREDLIATLYDCEAHGGGDDPDTPYAKWYVYYFEHSGKK